MRNNQCFVIGNLGADPMVRNASSPVVGFNIAENVLQFDKENHSYKTVHTNWFHVTAFGNMAERIRKGLKKGDRVAVRGRMKVSKYTDKTGEEKTGFEIIADEVAIWQNLPSVGESEYAPAFDEAIPF